MGHWFGLLWPRGPAGYLLSLIPAVLLRSLVGAVAKGNRVACRRLDSRRKIFFFGWLSFGFFRKTASHFDVSVATGWCDVFNPNVWFERRRKCKEAAYVHLSWQDFIPPPLVVIVLRLLFCFFFFYVLTVRWLRTGNVCVTATFGAGMATDQCRYLNTINKERKRI